MRRVSVVGGSSTGKTTLARELARRLGVPHVELDALHHEAGWQEAPADVLRARLEQALAVAPEGWVVDGNYDGKLGALVQERADTVVFLDLPLRLALGRVLRRSARRILTREEVWNGNRETLRRALSPTDSIVWWVIRMHHTNRAKWPGRLAELPHLSVVRLASQSEVDEFLRSVGP